MQQYQKLNDPLLSAADYALGFAFVTRQCPDREYIAFRQKSQSIAQMLCNRMPSYTRIRLDIDRNIRNSIALIKDYLKFIANPRNLFQRFFDLARVEIDTFDNQHIISASGNSIDTQRSASAGAFLARYNPGNIVGAIADNRHRLSR